MRKIIQGEVIHGDKRGKALGFPTANIALEQSLPQGIYISTTQIHAEKKKHQEKEFHSITFIGDAKMFGRTNILAETYILDFSDDIYGTNLIISIIKKLRDNIHFNSVEELIRQMKKDEVDTRAFFLKNNLKNSLI